jgi:ABC-type branched-subunit amino acid transport system ATPase component/ABC-type branched-subunit amino acid transport system permease subunit
VSLIAVGIGGWSISGETVVIGALTGLTYAVLAAGLILVFRATKVINFAQGEMGAFGAAILAKLVLDDHWNFWIALLAVTALGGVLGGLIEFTVVRRLFRAPRLILLVATIGVAQLVLVGQLVLPNINHAARYPSPFHQTLHVGTFLLRSEHFMVIALVPLVIIGLTLFLNRTPWGIAIRAAAGNAERAELVGISTKRISTLVWVLAGSLSTLTAVLINPLRGTIIGVPTLALGPSLLLRALAAALVGGLVSLPLALAGGVAIGVLEAVIFANVSNPGAADMALLVIVLVLVLTRGRTLGGAETGSWSLTPKVKAIPERVRAVWWVGHLNQLAGAAGLAVAVAAPLVFDRSSQLFLLSRVLLFAIVALSVTLLTGWAGQLSLGQAAFVGLGSMMTAALHARGMPFGVAVAYSVVAGVVAAVLVGFPALRVRGLALAVTTLAFAVAARGWILPHHFFVGNSAVVTVTRGEWLGIDLHAQRTYYFLCLVALVGCVLMVARLRSTGVGRGIIATRENEAAAASFTVSPTFAKLAAFGVAGGLAALAGGLLAGLRVQFGPDAFGPEVSLQVVAMTVIGGLGSVGGAVLGALYVIGLPALFNNNTTVALATSGIGLLVLLLFLPGGLIEVVYRARDLMVTFASRRLGRAEEPQRDRSVATALPAPGRAVELPPRTPVLVVAGITVRFGGRVALDNVSIDASPGEVVGLIGSNGAGKSTLMNVISGFVPARQGTVDIFGRDVTRYAPHERAALGVGRVFQDARLFGDLTVRETVMVALEAHERSELVPSLLALPPSVAAERRKRSQADAAIEFLGLGRFADAFLSDLSTGTRRIVELTCLLAQGAQLLLLDEPTAGLAQRETEAFAPLISQVRGELDATIVIIEHDMPLVMSISDRVYCLAAGQQLAEGTPDEIRHDPLVVSAYLGADERAIARSGRRPAGAQR